LAPSSSDDRSPQRASDRQPGTRTRTGIGGPPVSARTNEEMGIVQEASGRAMNPPPLPAPLLQPVIERADRDPGWAVAASRDGDRFVDLTAHEFYERVR